MVLDLATPVQAPEQPLGQKVLWVPAPRSPYLLGALFSPGHMLRKLRCSVQLAGSGRSSLSSIIASLARPSMIVSTISGANSASRRIGLL